MPRGDGATTHQRPATAVAPVHAAAPTAVTSSSTPAKLASTAAWALPRTAYAQAVVIPHVGQGRPVRWRNQQGDQPSCSCVPHPRASGVRLAAAATNAASTSPAPARPTRTPVDRGMRSVTGPLRLRRGSRGTGRSGRRLARRSGWGKGNSTHGAPAERRPGNDAARPRRPAGGTTTLGENGLPGAPWQHRMGYSSRESVLAVLPAPPRQRPCLRRSPPWHMPAPTPTSISA